MGDVLEVFLWVGGLCAFYFWFSNRIRRAHNQIRYEEFQKELLRRVAQQRKLDELYGRDEKNNSR